jgi:hypothetical protein
MDFLKSEEKGAQVEGEDKIDELFKLLIILAIKIINIKNYEDIVNLSFYSILKEVLNFTNSSFLN